ncbi:hypothetical protein HK100_008376 [Physocladia obscura]|uniref:Uncharacterized protein n=1 Tax=Physocladia obscura TaxID=109957 RepID=A0AAD5SNG7_9FUNG|nr:hypothetical protein HK100_008376 [Physocladia obscura]
MGEFCEGPSIAAMCIYLRTVIVVFEQRTGEISLIRRTYTPKTLNAALSSIFIYYSFERQHYECIVPVIPTPPISPFTTTDSPVLPSRDSLLGKGPANEDCTFPQSGVPLDPTKKPIVKLDNTLSPKSPFYFVDEYGILNLVTASFESFKRLKESDVQLPKKKIGPTCIGFYKTINTMKVKIDCPFGIKTRTKDNAYWNKRQWIHCLGCKILSNNLVYNPDVSVYYRIF